MYIISDVVNLVELTLVANKYLKENKMIPEIVHNLPNHKYLFSFFDSEEITIEGWVKKLKLNGVKELYISFSRPQDITLLGYKNSFPGGVISVYENGSVTAWKQKFLDIGDDYKEILYKEVNINPLLHDMGFLNKFQSNFKYFKCAVKEMIRFSENLGCEEWKIYFGKVLELEDIEKAKKCIAVENLNNVISDKSLCVYAMAMQAYPFGGMGSWCDEPYSIAISKGLESSYDNYSWGIFSELMGMLAYVTNRF